MTGGQWSVLSARFREWWDRALVAESAEVPAASGQVAPSGDASLVLIGAAEVTASRSGPHLDFSMLYEPLPHARFGEAHFIGDRWKATLRNGKQLQGRRGGSRDLGDRGVSFLLDPSPILEHSDLLGSQTLAEGTRALQLREPLVSSVVGRDGKLVKFKKPSGPWLHLADDVVVANADRYHAILDPAADILRQWDALHGERILRRLELIDVSLAKPAR